MIAQAAEIVTIDFAGTAFDYHFGHDCLDAVADRIGALGADLLIVVTDDTVLGLHGAALLPRLRQAQRLVVLSAPAGEAIKSVAHLGACLHRAIEAGATRRSVVVTFGGGVPGNLGGLLAALLFRGIRLVHLATTTVGAMDSVLSFKQAVNSAFGKNHIGAYHAPCAVHVDTALMRTLPARELRSGLCEAAKNGLAIRPEALPQLRALLAAGDLAAPKALDWLLRESLAAKLSVMAGDATERAAGLILEYGHTVGHAVELCDQRLRGPAGLSHGEAVAIGMLAAARISRALGFLDAEGLRLHEAILAALGVVPRCPEGLRAADILEVVRADNKRGYLDLGPEEVAMVLLTAPGLPTGPPERPLVAVPMAAVRRAVEDLLEPAGQPAERARAACATRAA